jgi:hypothetical protein
LANDSLLDQVGDDLFIYLIHLTQNLPRPSSRMIRRGDLRLLFNSQRQALDYVGKKMTRHTMAEISRTRKKMAKFSRKTLYSNI